MSVVKRVHLQHPIKEVELTIHSNTALFRNSGIIIYKMENHCFEIYTNRLALDSYF